MRAWTIMFALALLVGCSDRATPEKEAPVVIVMPGEEVCGDGSIDGDEVCDRDALDGTTCEDLGLGAGTLACRPNCSGFDRAECGAPETCGNGAVDDAEECDGAEVGGATCESLGFGPGELGCTPNCAQFDTANCGPLETCGNGTIDDLEVCDGTALGNATCDGLGLGSGTLACASNCQRYDTTGCMAGCTPDCSATECGPDPVCGTDCGSCNAGEQCTGAGQCMCVPTTCAAVGAQCGSIDDGCGGMLDCGGCPGAQTCGADNTCGCATVANGGTVTVDVPVVDIQFQLTIGGQPLGATNTNAYDEGGLILVDTVTGERIVLPDAFDGAVTFPQTWRVIPGTYDIHYYNDGATDFWPVNDDNRLMEAVDLTTSKTVTVDVPVVEITFALTIGGQALSAANTNAYDEGGLILVDPVTGERIVLPDAFDGGVTFPQQWRLIPGVYDIYYYNDGATDFWPVNDDNQLMEAVDLTTSKTVAVDVPVVDITFRLTIGGQALSTTNTNAYDEGGLVLVDSVTGERIVLPDAFDGALTYPQTWRVIPGIYDIYYYNDGATDFWPVNDNYELMSGVDLRTSKTLNVDVPVVEITFDLTIGGQALSAANTNAYDEGGLILVDSVTGERIVLPDAFDGAVTYPQTWRVIPGTYDIYFYNDGATSFWPVNDDTRLMQAVDLSSTKTVAVDVPVVDITFDLTIGGQQISAANTNAYDEGGLILVDTTTGERIVLPDAFDGAVTYPQTWRVIPGTYDIHYYNDGATSFWPVNDDKRLMEAVALTSSKTVAVDVPVVDVTFELLIGGQSLSTTNTNAYDEGGLVLVDPVTGERIVLPDAFDGTVTYPQTWRIIPGSYDVHYYNDGAAMFWPVNDDTLLTCFSVP